MYNYILFDLDGTLVDTKEGITKSVQYSLTDFGIHIKDLDELTAFIGPPLGSQYGEIYGMDEQQVTRAVALFRQRYEKTGIFECSLFPGIKALLESLKAAGKNLAVATSKIESSAVIVLEHLGISSYFDIIAGGDLKNTRSTKALVVDAVLNFYGITEDKKHSAVLIGDTKYDAAGAVQCGIDCIGVAHGYAKDGELIEAGAVAVVPNAAALYEKLGI